MKSCLKRILAEDDLIMTDVQNILADEMNIHFSLPYVCKIVRDLGFN